MNPSMMDSFLSSAPFHFHRNFDGRRGRRGGFRGTRRGRDHAASSSAAASYLSSSSSSSDYSSNTSPALSSFSPSDDRMLTSNESFSERRSRKKRICRAFLSDGGCHRGSECDSAHDAAEGSLCDYAINGRCRFGDRCMWIHGELCSTCHRYALHPFNKQQRDDHQHTCRLSSKQQSKNEAATNGDGTVTVADEETESKGERFECSVCYETLGSQNRTAALLSGCDHPFCLQCIQEWRGKRREYQSKEDVTRSCPICRKISVWILPHYRHLKDGTEKSALMQRARESMAQKPCRNYSSNQHCFFGRACFYQHINPDGVQINDPLTDGGKSEFIGHRPNKIPRSIRALMPSIFDDSSDNEQHEDAIGIGRQLQNLIRAMTISSNITASYDSDEERENAYADTGDYFDSLRDLDELHLRSSSASDDDEWDD